MLIAEYDYATDMAVQRQEAWEDAWDEAWKQASEETWDKAWAESRQERDVEIARNMLKAGVDVSIIASSTGLSPEVILKLQEQQQKDF